MVFSVKKHAKLVYRDIISPVPKAKVNSFFGLKPLHVAVKDKYLSMSLIVLIYRLACYIEA